MESKDDVLEAPKATADSLQIYARIRKIMPWEPTKKAIKWSKKNIEAVVRNNVQSYQFSRVFKPGHNNKDCFIDICKPMAEQVLDGYNAVLIAYGQTGSGKTHSLLGKPSRNVLGILPMVIEFFMNCPNSTVSLGAVEAFGHHVNRIDLYDLFSPNCQSPDWSEKISKTSLAEKEMVFVTPRDPAHGNLLVSQAQKASHFAPTGKNPESSRGHISFIVRVVQENKETFQKLESYFIIVDLAGSEGETAFTPEFKARVDPSTLMARRLEAGVINTGLSQLQIIFNELKVKGRLSKMEGVGLRRVLHPYINAKCVLSVLFCISPSQVNLRSTVATLKFAVQAGMVTVKPVKEAAVTNWPLLVKGLKDMIANLNKDIDDREQTISRLMDELDTLRKKPGMLVSAAPSSRRRRQHMRQRSQLPDDVNKLMCDAEMNIEEEDEIDEKDRADIDEVAVDEAMKKGIEQQRGDQEAVALFLGVEKEHMIRTKTNLFSSMTVLDLGESLPIPGQTVNKTICGSIQENNDEATDNSDAETQEIEIMTNVEHDCMPSDIGDRKIILVQQCEGCEVMESLLEAERTLNESYLYSQQVIIDHLAETNEGLLQFFRVKEILGSPSDVGKKKKKKKKSKKKKKKEVASPVK